MTTIRRDWLNATFTALLAAAVGCLIGSLLWGLGHPLFWNDEGMTVMHARRVTEYGYPKAWDGKNMVYDLLHPDKELGLDKTTGAFIGGSGWGHYYYAAPVVALVESIEDDHTRTALIRLWFVLAGLVGLWVIGRLVSRAIPQRRQRRAALLLFVVGLLLSIPLALHLREARYYSLTVLLVGMVLAQYARKSIFAGQGFDTRKAWLLQQVSLTLTLLALLLTFAPAFLALAATLGSAATLQWISSGWEGGRFRLRSLQTQFGQVVKAHLYLMLSALALIPFLLFFRTMEINNALAESNTRLDFYTHYRGNFASILDYLFRFEPLLLMLALKLGLAFAFRQLWGAGQPEVRRQLKLSGLLGLAFFFSIAFAARIPNDMFIRYFVHLIPLLYAQVALDGIILWNWLCPRPRWMRVPFALAFVGLFLWPIPHNLPHIRGHVAELREPVKGHLDYMIPFLREQYGEGNNLVIAANYEESCFMYYLDAKVTVGYVQAHMEEDLRHRPDVIYFNSYWSWGEMPRAMDFFLAGSKYGRALFPVGKYRVNNIPEVHYKPELEHQYRTRKPIGPRDQAELLIRIE